MLQDILNNVRPEVYVWLAVGILFLAFVVDKLRKPKRKLPPGPVGLPVVGYLPFLTKDSHLKLIKLAEKYGDVFSLYLGSQLVVILNDADSIREAFSKREFLGRPPNTAVSLFGFQNPFFSADFHMWQEQRRFVMQTMKDLGLGKSKIEGHIQDEIRHFLKVLGETEGIPMNVIKPLTPSMSNNICSLVFGERYDYNDPVRIIMDKTIHELGESTAQTALHIFFPWMRKIPFLMKLMNYEEIIEAVNKFYSVVDEKIREHKVTLEPKNIRDFIDGYLVEMKNRVDKELETTFSDETLKGNILTLFGAGSETVNATISWCMYIMAAFPEVQKKVQKEIDDALGPNKFPEFTDQKDMPYTQAVIREIMRWKTVGPLNVVRYTLDDTDVSGQYIPKGTVVIANWWAVHHSPKYWKDPEDFKPERFLNSDGMLLKSNYYMPFSIGKRACPGETMAMMEIFLYFVSILQKFQVSFPEGYEPTFDAELGITFRLKPFEICFTSK